MISKPRARPQNTACSDIHCACIWCVGVRTGSSGQVYQLTACVASVQILLCTPQNSLCCSSIIFPKHWSIRKPIILLLHKCHINRILYAFFHSARCLGLIYTAVCAEKHVPYISGCLFAPLLGFTGVQVPSSSFPTALLSIPSSSFILRISSSSCFWRYFIEVPGCNAFLIYLSLLGLLNIFNCACTIWSETEDILDKKTYKPLFWFKQSLLWFYLSNDSCISFLWQLPHS